MKPVRSGDRGPAVEDIQRRLRTLGYELGPTGVDGVFFGRTAEAVRAFQTKHELAEDGLVGDETWSALVDATFQLGDRMLYLRLPHFHGYDVRVLQEALSALGFACGQVDGIFGAYSERALREFQRNVGLVPDGIAGADTVRAVMALRHVWEGKDPRAHSAAHVAPARAAEVLAKVALGVGGIDEVGAQTAERVVNLAHATSSDARVRVLKPGAESFSECSAILMLCVDGTASAVPGRPVVRLDPPDSLASRLLTAVAAARRGCPEVVVELPGSDVWDEHVQQRAAVMLLDAVCIVFD